MLAAEALERRAGGTPPVEEGAAGHKGHRHDAERVLPHDARAARALVDAQREQARAARVAVVVEEEVLALAEVLGVVLRGEDDGARRRDRPVREHDFELAVGAAERPAAAPRRVARAVAAAAAAAARADDVGADDRVREPRREHRARVVLEQLQVVHVGARERRHVRAEELGAAAILAAAGVRTVAERDQRGPRADNDDDGGDGGCELL